MKPYLLALLLAALPAFTQAQDAAPGRWFVSAGAHVTGFQDGRDAWEAVGSGVGFDGDRTDVYAEVLRSSRYDLAETRILLDAYRVLGRLAYVNLRGLWSARSRVHPSSDLAAELYLSAPGGWEPALQVRRMNFRDGSAMLGAAALARYTGAYYLRAQLIASRTEAGASGLAATSAVRRYWGDRNFVEIRPVWGRQLVQLESSPAPSSGYGLALLADWGLKPGVRLRPTVELAHDDILGSRMGGGIQVRVGS